VLFLCSVYIFLNIFLTSVYHFPHEILQELPKNLASFPIQLFKLLFDGKVFYLP